MEVLPAEAAPVEEAPVEEPSLAETLTDVGVALADENGVPLALASQAAEELVSNGDPFLWVGTTKYSYMVSCGTTANCTEDPNPIQKAIDDIKTG